MFLVLLKFSANKGAAAQFMRAHNDWIAKGVEDGVFLVVGSLQPKAGGAVLAHRLDAQEIQKRVAEDPFVVEDVVRPEILEITPNRTDPRLEFLMAQSG